MAEVTTAMVKELRERTGLGMMECKNALKSSEGDIDVAIEELRKSSGLKAAKKAGRIAAEGAVSVKVSADNTYAIIAEVNSETDFAAREEGFLKFVSLVTETAFTSKTTDVAVLMSGDMEKVREELVQKIGENIGVRRIDSITADTVAAYVHGGSRIAVLVALKGGNAELAKDVAMHVAAANPQYVSVSHVPADVVAKEKEILIAQAQAEAEESGKPKPLDIIEKMIGGRIQKFLAGISLTEQAFIKDPDVTVGKLLEKAGADIISFIRFEVGEGIEKEEKDFAQEVAEQLAKK